MRNAWLALAAALISCACGSTAPSRFYLLTPALDAADDAEPAGPASVRLTTVELPRYLSGPEIAVRNGNELDYAEYDRWGEPLKDNFTRVLAHNLTVLMPETNVSRYLWEWPGRVERQVALAVQRFDVENGEAILEARWAFFGDGHETVAGTGPARYVHPVEGEGYDAIAAAMSACLADFSRELARDLRANAVQE